MASKSEMITTLQDIFGNYKEEFLEVGITDTDYYKWVVTLKLYPELKKGYNFILKKFLFQLQIIQKVLKQHPKHAWPALKQFDASNVQVRMLRLTVKETRTLWKKRPKAQRYRQS